MSPMPQELHQMNIPNTIPTPRTTQLKSRFAHDDTMLVDQIFRLAGELEVELHLASEARNAWMTRGSGRRSGWNFQQQPHTKMTEQQALQLIDERDAAEKALAEAYHLVTGQVAEWSNNFGYAEALEEIAEWCAPDPVRDEPLTPRENDMIEAGLAKIYRAERDTALRVLAELNHRVHSGYDWNADPDYVTLLVGAALNLERLPDRWAAGAGVWRCAPSLFSPAPGSGIPAPDTNAEGQAL